MNIGEFVSQTPFRLLFVAVTWFLSLFLATLIIERSIEAAFKGVKLALKFEFTTDAGRLNLVGTILVVVVILVTNLHAMFAETLSTERSKPADHVTAPAVLIGVFIWGSMFIVMLLERKK